MAADKKLQIILEVDSEKGVAKLGSFDKALNGTMQTTRRAGTTIPAYLKPIGGAIVGAFAVDALIEFGAETQRLARQSQSLNRSFVAIAGDSQAAQNEFKFLRQESDRLGQNFWKVADSYKGIYAASQSTNMAGQQTREIFLGITEAGTALGLTSEQMDGALRAVEQMMSKGNVQAEELRGQLGERLPGAFQLAAQAMGVSTSALNGMLERGEVMADDLLPKLASLLRSKYGKAAVEASQDSAAAARKFDEAMQDLSTTIGTKIQPGVDSVTRTLTAMAQNLNIAIKEGTVGEFLYGLWTGESFKAPESLTAQIEHARELLSIADEEVKKVQDDLDKALAARNRGDTSILTDWVSIPAMKKALQARLEERKKYGDQLASLTKQQNQDLRALEADAMDTMLADQNKAFLQAGIQSMKNSKKQQAAAKKAAKERAKIEEQVADAIIKATMDEFEQREAKLDEWVEDYRKAGGDVAAIEDKLGVLRLANYAESVEAALETERKKSEALGKGALERGKIDEQELKDSTERAKKRAEAVEEYALAMAEYTGDSLTAQSIRHEQFVREWTERLGDRDKAEKLWSAKLVKDNESIFTTLGRQWTDVNLIAVETTKSALQTIQQNLANTIYNFLIGDINSLGDAWEATWKSMAQIAANVLSQLATGAIASGIGGIFDGLFGKSGSSAGGTASGIMGSLGGSALWAGVKAGWSSLFGGSTAALTEMATNAAINYGVTSEAATMAAINAEIGGSSGVITGSTGGTGALNTGSLAAMLASPAGAMALGIAPGMIGMLFGDQINSLFGWEGKLTPEKAISNWGGQAGFLEATANQLTNFGTVMTGVNESFGYFSQSAEDAWIAFERLGTVAGYTQAELDAVYNSLSPTAQKLLDSGKAAVEAEEGIRSLATAIAETRDAGEMTEEAMAAFQDRIDALAASFGLSGEAADRFSHDIWDASRDVYTGTGAIIQMDDAISDLADSVVDSMAALANTENGITSITNSVSGLADAMTGLATSASSAANATGSIKGGSKGSVTVGIGGSFDTGGVVPGPIGQPMLAVVHGGEEVLTPAQRSRRGERAGEGDGDIIVQGPLAVFNGTNLRNRAELYAAAGDIQDALDYVKRRRKGAR
ncbi:MAG: tape measure protein [Pseudomonadota bacterium]